jgi:hypothetical protein
VTRPLSRGSSLHDNLKGAPAHPETEDIRDMMVTDITLAAFTFATALALSPTWRRSRVAADQGGVQVISFATWSVSGGGGSRMAAVAAITDSPRRDRRRAASTCSCT